MDWGWLANNAVGIVGIAVGGFIAYHVHFLEKRLTNSDKLKHQESIKKKTDDYLYEIQKKKLRRKVYLVNINRYFKDYPSNEERVFEGYSHIRADIKATWFDGIEFFSGMPEAAYLREDGKLHLSGTEKQRVFNAFPVGVVPYEWIEYIDLNGDEYAYIPLFYCHFKGWVNWSLLRRLKFMGYPFKEQRYYKIRDTYREGSDPPNMEYELIEVLR